jgi:DNA/RNA endonuclease YhcR with UshA esterase domain
MRSLGRISLIALLLVFMAAAQQKPVANSDVPRYDTAHQQVFTGIVQEVKEYHCPVTGTVGTHIAVKGVMETVEVHLAPVTFMKQYDIVIKAGDKVSVTGTKLTFDGKPAMIAKEIKVANDTFSFRDNKGRPLW